MTSTKPSPQPVRSDKDDDDGLDTPQIRALRMAVSVMGLILVVGLLTVIARIVYLASRPAAQAVAPAAATATAPVQALHPEAILDLPADANVRSLSLSGDRLAVQYVSPRGEGIAILDLVTGKVVSRVRVAPGAAK